MQRLTYVTVLATFLFFIGQAAAAEPKVPENVLVKPTFLLANGSWSGGCAFLLRVPDRPETLLVTCHHLFGPATGQEAQMSSDDIAKNVCGVVGLSMQDRKTIVVAHTYLRGAGGARAIDNAGAEKDVAAFIVDPAAKPAPAPAALELAAQMPRLGETVFVFARLRSQSDPKLYAATVGAVANNQLLYTFADKSIDLRGTSGAPVLDARGHVVGMNVGGGEENGQLLGIANPADALRAAVSPAGK